MIRKLTEAELDRIGCEPIDFRMGRGPIPILDLEMPYDRELTDQFKRNHNGLILPVRYADE